MTTGWRADPAAEALICAGLAAHAGDVADCRSWLMDFVGLVRAERRASTPLAESLSPAERRLLPLCAGLPLDLAPDEDGASLLRAARRLRREARLETLGLAVRSRPIIGSLRAVGVRPIVLKGMALGPLVYGDPGLRPLADLDLLVAPEEVPAALVVLAASSLTPAEVVGADTWPPPARLNLARAAVTHACNFGDDRGLSIDLHWAALSTHCGHSSDDGFRRDRRPLGPSPLGEVDTLSLPHHLVHALVHGLRYNPEPSWRWIPDAMLLIRAGALAADPVDGPAKTGCPRAEFVREVLARGLSTMVSEALGYLGERFGSVAARDVGRELALRQPSRLERWRQQHHAWPWDRPKPIPVIAWDLLRFLDGERGLEAATIAWRYVRFRALDGGLGTAPRRLFDKLIAPRLGGQRRRTRS